MKYYIEEVRRLNGEFFFSVKDEKGWCYQTFHFRDHAAKDSPWNYEANLESAKSYVLELRNGKTETIKIIDF